MIGYTTNARLTLWELLASLNVSLKRVQHKVPMKPEIKQVCKRGIQMISTVTNNRCKRKSASTMSLFLSKTLNLSPIITWNNQTLQLQIKTEISVKTYKGTSLLQKVHKVFSSGQEMLMLSFWFTMQSSSATVNSEGNCEWQVLCMDPKNCLNSENRNDLSSSQNSGFRFKTEHTHITSGISTHWWSVCATDFDLWDFWAFQTLKHKLHEMQATSATLRKISRTAYCTCSGSWWRSYCKKCRACEECYFEKETMPNTDNSDTEEYKQSH